MRKMSSSGKPLPKGICTLPSQSSRKEKARAKAKTSIKGSLANKGSKATVLALTNGDEEACAEEEDNKENYAKCLAKAKSCRDLLSRTCLDLEQAMTMADKAKRLTALSRKEAQQALDSCASKLEEVKTFLLQKQLSLAKAKSLLQDAIKAQKAAKEEAKELVQLANKAGSKASKASKATNKTKN